MKYSLFIGRYQPFHAGHKALMDTVLRAGGNVAIGLRDTPLDNDNPYTLRERIAKIQDFYPEAQWLGHGRITIFSIPDISEVCYGRKVGYGIRQIELDEETEKISASAIRKETGPDYVVHG